MDTKASRCTRPGDSPLTYLMSSGNSRMNSSATTMSSSTGAASNVSLISAASNSPPEATLPRASSSQKTSPPRTSSATSRWYLWKNGTVGGRDDRSLCISRPIRAPAVPGPTRIARHTRAAPAAMAKGQ